MGREPGEGEGDKMAIGPNFYIARRQANVTLNIT
jgi:hypothetical protein